MRRWEGDHARNVGPMTRSPRCGAKTRAGAACRSLAVGGKSRCRMHGGMRGSGAPNGNQNALKNGLYTREMITRRRELAQLIREARATLRDLS